MEMILTLLTLAVTSGFLTEVVKWAGGKVISQLPPKLTPVLAAGIGSGIGFGGEALAPALGLSPGIGLVGGLLATVLHQLKSQPWDRGRKAKRAVAWLLLAPAAWLIGGCIHITTDLPIAAAVSACPQLVADAMTQAPAILRDRLPESLTKDGCILDLRLGPSDMTKEDLGHEAVDKPPN